MKQIFVLFYLVAVWVCLPAAVSAQAEDGEEQLRIELRYLQDRLNEISRYNSISLSSEYEALLLEVGRLFLEYPEAAGVWGISGIIKYDYQEALDDESSLTIAESAKNDLETAIAMDPNVLDGAPYVYLGNLYMSTPAWPSGFGDEDRAEELLRRGVALNPEDLDANYFLARLLIRRGEVDEAKSYLENALLAPASEEREARRQTVEDLLGEL